MFYIYTCIYIKVYKGIYIHIYICLYIYPIIFWACYTYAKVLSRARVLPPMNRDSTFNASGMLLQTLYVLLCKDLKIPKG